MRSLPGTRPSSPNNNCSWLGGRWAEPRPPRRALKPAARLRVRAGAKRQLAHQRLYRLGLRANQKAAGTFKTSLSSGADAPGSFCFLRIRLTCGSGRRGGEDNAPAADRAHCTCCIRGGSKLPAWLQVRASRLVGLRSWPDAHDRDAGEPGNASPASHAISGRRSICRRVRAS
jgi:hypothetical protein